jgi:hypothetical protein
MSFSIVRQDTYNKLLGEHSKEYYTLPFFNPNINSNFLAFSTGEVMLYDPYHKFVVINKKYPEEIMKKKLGNEDFGYNEIWKITLLNTSKPYIRNEYLRVETLGDDRFEDGEYLIENIFGDSYHVFLKWFKSSEYDKCTGICFEEKVNKDTMYNSKLIRGLSNFYHDIIYGCGENYKRLDKESE